MVMTSKLDSYEWGDTFLMRFSGTTTIDRLRHGPYRVILDGQSYQSANPLPDLPRNQFPK
jgi:DNA replication protein DnaC